MEKPKKEETVTVSIENKDSVEDSMGESAVKLNYLNESSSDDLQFLDAEGVEHNNTPKITNDLQSNNSPQATQPVNEIKEKRPSRYC